MFKKFFHWIDNKLLGEYIVLTIICIVVLIGGFGLYKADNHQKSDRYYTDENGIQREVKFVKINNYLYYDDYTKAVYYQEGRAGRMVQYVGKHLKPCKYINGRVVEQKD